MILDDLLTHSAKFISRIEKGRDDYGNMEYYEKESITKCFLSSVSKRAIEKDGGQVFYQASVLFIPPTCEMKKGDKIKDIFSGSNRLSTEEFQAVAVQASFDDDGIDHYEVELSSIEIGNA